MTEILVFVIHQVLVQALAAAIGLLLGLSGVLWWLDRKYPRGEGP